jgi:vancomycin resistance protein YoaR
LAAHGSTTAGRMRRRVGVGVGTRRLAVALALALVGMLGVGYAFAGSAGRLPGGTRIDGVDVGGMTPGHASSVLKARAAALAGVPVTFAAGGRRWRIRPISLGVTADWRDAIAAAERRGGGFGPIRGYRRILLRFSPVSLTARPRAYDAAVVYEVGLFGAAIDEPARGARLVRHGLRLELVPGRSGTTLDRTAAARVIVRALAGFDRATVPLPVRTTRPRVTPTDLLSALRLDRMVLSAPVTLRLGPRRWQISRGQLASMLLLQQDRHSGLKLGGPAANRYFAHLVGLAHRPPRDAGFAVDGPAVRITPAETGLGIDVPRTIHAVLNAARRVHGRSASIVVAKLQPRRSTAEAKAMGITGLVSSYETFYGGIPNRIHNVQLVAHLIDGKLIPPAGTFSFNEATGERTAAKGFLAAPVIINGELQTALGGGVCQVSTTVFNAAYEAGLRITARTNHALYISHYPLGRDATVDYPDTDLKFANDTKRWLLVRTFVGPSSLVVSLYGTPQGRRVVTDTAPLVAHGRPPIERTVDATLKPGEKVIDDAGVPAQTTSVRRRVYAPDGALLYDNTWYSSYQAEPELVRVGPKPKPARPKPVLNLSRKPLQ